jgi:predicted RNase H-like nuclease
LTTKHLVLGIDAAWTATNPSGVALVMAQQQGWECLGLAPSYSQFEALSKGMPIDWNAKPDGEIPQFASLLAAASRLADNHSATLICIDMPLSQLPIVSRRVADRRISQEFGRYGCSTHSPTATRPGILADRIRRECEDLGFRLATADSDIGKTPALLEVYPHPALLTLMRADYRIPYKVSKTKRYWPDSSPQERMQKLLSAFAQIHARLASFIQGVSLPLPDAIPRSLESLKRYEDAIDALICAWVGTRFLERRCRAYGDNEAAVWVPDND